MRQRRVLRSLSFALVAGGLAALAPAPAAAQQYLFGFIDMVRGGVLAHDFTRDSDESQTVDLNLEFVFAPLWRFDTGNRFLDAVVNPRPVFGGFINTEGETHHGYLGFDWMLEFESGPFIEASFGAAVHSGRLEQGKIACTPAEIAAFCGSREPVGFIFESERQTSLGSRVLFRESIDLGWRFGDRHYVSLGYAHMSNAGLDEDNDGMDFVGLRYGFRFGPRR